MSQPLTGIIRRRWGDLPKTEYALILSLADMVDSTTRQWRSTWTDLARRSRWPIRTLTHAGYRLRDARWLQIQSTGRGIVITLTPESGVSFQQFGRQSIADQKGNPLPTSSATHCLPGRQPAAGIDRPPITPLGANAPLTPSVFPGSVSTPKGVLDVENNGKPAPLGSAKGPGNPIPPRAGHGPKRPRLSTSERISLEKESANLVREIDRVRDKHESAEDWTDREKANVARWKARVDELCTQLGSLRLYHPNQEA